MADKSPEPAAEEAKQKKRKPAGDGAEGKKKAKKDGGAEKKTRKKAECPFTYEEFEVLAKQEAVDVKIGPHSLEAAPKRFGTGAFGWAFHANKVLTLGGKEITVRVGLNLTIAGSKPKKKPAGKKKKAADEEEDGGDNGADGGGDGDD